MSAKPRIDDAAIDLFTRLGVDAATTKEIAAAAGVSEGAIYRHYRSKDELAVSLFMRAHRRLSELVVQVAGGEMDIKARAAAIVAAYCQAADEDWPLFSFHLLSLHRFIPYYQDDGLDPVTTVEKVLKAAMISTEIPPADPRILASMIIGVVRQTAENLIYGRFDGPLSKYAEPMTKAVQAVLFAR